MSAIAGSHAFYMTLAAQAASQYLFLTHPNPAVGAAVLDRHGKLLALSAHQRAGGPHAEVYALQQALATYLNPEAARALLALQASEAIHHALLEAHGDHLRGATLYVTLEPCMQGGKTPACAPLIAKLGIGQVVIGAYDPNEKMAGGLSWLRAQGVETIGPVEPALCERLIAPFVALQKRGVYRLFKWAQRLSGSVDGGEISCPEALKEVHRIRHVADYLAIGGDTVRIDRPTLDARHVQGRAPDVAILSRRDDFDREIALFKVPHRQVRIQPDLEGLGGLVLIEGGPRLLDRLFSQLDGLLVYQSGALKGGLSVDSDRSATVLFNDRIGTTLKTLYRPDR